MIKHTTDYFLQDSLIKLAINQGYQAYAKGLGIELVIPNATPYLCTEGTISIFIESYKEMKEVLGL